MPYPFSELFPSTETFPGFGEEPIDEETTDDLSDVGFFRNDLDADWAFVRGAARLIIAPNEQAFPSSLSDVIDLDTYNLQPDWEELGATMGGISISLSREDVPYVNQSTGQPGTQPINWNCQLTTNLAENTLEHYQISLQSGTIEENDVQERVMGTGQSTTYNKNKLAVLFKNQNTELIRMFAFRKVQLQLVTSEINFAQSSEQIGLPIGFNILPDFSISEVKQRFCSIIEQIS